MHAALRWPAAGPSCGAFDRAPARVGGIPHGGQGGRLFVVFDTDGEVSFVEVSVLITCFLALCRTSIVRIKDFAISISFGEHQVMARLIAKRGLMSPLIHKDVPVCHPRLVCDNVASVNLNHQK